MTKKKTIYSRADYQLECSVSRHGELTCLKLATIWPQARNPANRVPHNILNLTLPRPVLAMLGRTITEEV